MLITEDLHYVDNFEEDALLEYFRRATPQMRRAMIGKYGTQVPKGIELQQDTRNRAVATRLPPGYAPGLAKGRKRSWVGNPGGRD